MALITRFSQKCYMDFDTRFLHCSDGSQRRITERYFFVILERMTADNAVHTREEIIRWRWGFDKDVEDRTVDKQMSKVRNLDPDMHDLFISVGLTGYQYTGATRREETEEPPPPPRRGALTVSENSDWGLRQPQITRELDEYITPQRMVGRENTDGRAAFTGGFRRRRNPITIEEALDKLEDLLGRVDCAQPPECQKYLLKELGAFFEEECAHFEQAADLQSLYSLIMQGLSFFRDVPGQMAARVCSMLDGWEFSFHIRVLEQKISLCNAGLEAARKGNLIRDVMRFQRQLEHYEGQLDEATQIHNLSHQTDF